MDQISIILRFNEKVIKIYFLCTYSRLQVYGIYLGHQELARKTGRAFSRTTTVAFSVSVMTNPIIIFSNKFSIVIISKPLKMTEIA